MPNAPSPPAVPVPPGKTEGAIATEPKRRGAKPGVKRGPSREPEDIFMDKMESAIKTTNLLLEKLTKLRDSRQVRGDSAMAAKYVAYLTKLQARITDCVPSAKVAGSESVLGWISP